MPQPDLAAAVTRVLAATLASSGFNVTEGSATSVTLERDRGAVRLSYNREDLPRAWLSVTIGVSEVRGVPSALVALWRVFPDALELQDPDVLGFGTQEELEERLVRVRDDWLTKFIAPALMSEARLRTAVSEQDRELLVEHEALKREQQLRDARSLFDSKNYQGAMEAFVLAGTDSLSAADWRRLALARRHLSEGRT